MKPGEKRLRDALQRRKATRRQDPEPYDDNWGWWINKRLQRLETGQKWLIGLAASTLAAEFFRIALKALWGG